MKVFAIRDENEQKNQAVSYLLYFEKEKKFYIEAPSKIDYWKAPLVISSFVKRNEFTINSYWSMVWVEQRIVPRERQNLGEILRSNRLKEYDEYKLLVLSEGRCAQDSYYIEEIDEKSLPKCIIKRMEQRIEYVLPIGDYSLIVFFKNGVAKKVNVISILRNFQNGSLDFYETLLNTFEDKRRFDSFKTSPGGYGIMWSDDVEVTYDKLYKIGYTISIDYDSIENIVKHEVLSISEVCEILHCSRQNVDDLISRGKLAPIKSAGKVKLFLRRDVERRLR